VTAAELLRVLAPLAAYVVLVLVVGGLATRRAGASPDEYFLAGRRLGPIVLFMALFGTNATAFVLIGVPGRAYHDGVGFFGANAAIVALFTPLTFLLVGLPARKMAMRLGAVSPAELYARRFGSTALGVLMFAFFTVYTIPYMVSAIVGASLVLDGTTGGAIPAWAGGLGVVGVALVYTMLGGMRATAWTNVLQGVIFMGFLLAAFIVVAAHFGGLPGAMRMVEAHDPDLLRLDRTTGIYRPKQWFSWALLISLTVVGFPHMFVRLLAARSERALKGVCRLYPIAILALWLPPVMLGVWGAAQFPGLEGRESDRIFQIMVDDHLSPGLAALGFVAVLAAVMSTLDAMILTLSSMLVRDVLDRVHPARSPRADVVAGRVFAVAVAALAWILAQTLGGSIVAIATWGFAGFVAMTPVLYLGVRWRRLTLPGAIVSLLVGNGVLYLAQLAEAPWLGFLPVFWGFAAALATALLVSVLTPPAAGELTRDAFGP
jgi:SSS family solute:Na+ symporter